MSFGGEPLQKGGGGTRNDVSGVVFVTFGEKLPTATLQVGILLTDRFPSASAFNDWTLDEYRRSPTQQYYESKTADEACKIGLPPGPIRPFVAVQVCRAGGGYAACAEADERLDGDYVGRCLSEGWSCWERICSWRFEARRASLVAVLQGVLGRP
jgi:hypothetical protein